jgi:hypothetical protein
VTTKIALLGEDRRFAIAFPYTFKVNGQRRNVDDLSIGRQPDFRRWAMRPSVS